MIERFTEMVRNAKQRSVIRERYRRVFGTEDGRVVLAHILRQGHVLSTTFVAGDSHQTALNEGMRRLALSIARAVYKNETEMQQQVEKGIQNEENPI